VPLPAGPLPPKEVKGEEDNEVLSEGDAGSLLDALVKVGRSLGETCADVERSSSSWRAATEDTVDQVRASEGTRSASSVAASAARDAESKAVTLAAPKIAPWVATPVPPPPTGVPHPKLPSSMAPAEPVGVPRPKVPPSRAARPPEPLVPPRAAMRPPEPLVPPKMAVGPPAPPKVPPPTGTRDGARTKAAAPNPVVPEYSHLDDCYFFSCQSNFPLLRR
jgi:hypothetical protein